MKKTILGLSAALLIATSLIVYAQPKEAKAAAANERACDPDEDCICVPTPDGGYVCVPKSSATQVQLAAAVDKPACPNTDDCICE